MKKKIIAQLLSLILTFSLSACIAQASEKEETAGDTGDSGASVVYMTAEISPEGMMAVYEAMGVETATVTEIRLNRIYMTSVFLHRPIP